MDKKINNFDFDFMPIGQAIKKAREAKKVTREQLAEIVDYSARHIQSVENEGQHLSCLFNSSQCLMFRLTNISSQIRKQIKVPSAGVWKHCLIIWTIKNFPLSKQP